MPEDSEDKKKNRTFELKSEDFQENEERWRVKALEDNNNNNNNNKRIHNALPTVDRMPFLTQPFLFFRSAGYAENVKCKTLSVTLTLILSPTLTLSLTLTQPLILTLEHGRISSSMSYS